MKKHNTFKVLGICFLLVLIASYFLVDRSGEHAYIGIIDMLMTYIKSIYYFYYIVLFLLAVGGLYGVLTKTPSYKKLLDNIVSMVKPLGKKFIFVLIMVMSIITSFTGLSYPLVIIIPFICSIVLLLGYDKLVALSVTVGSIVVGYMGGVFVTFFNKNTSLLNTYESFVGLDNQFANVFPKLLLLFTGVALLIGFVNSYIVRVENKKVKYELGDDSSVAVSEVKGDYKKLKVWPMAVTLILLVLFIFLGAFPFYELFGVEFFTDLHNVFIGLTIGKVIVRLVLGIVFFGLIVLVEWIISLLRKKKFKFGFLLPVWLSIIALLICEVLHTCHVGDVYGLSFMESFLDLLSGNAFFDFKIFTDATLYDIRALGAWFSEGETYGYFLLSSVLLIFTIIIAIVNKMKFDETIDSFLDGIKKAMPTVLLTIFAYSFLVFFYQNGYIEALITNYNKFNYGVSSILTLLGSMFMIEHLYIGLSVYSPILNVITDESIFSSVALLFQGIYGIFMILSPTSIVLLFAITYLDVPYTTWIKYIWRFILGLIIVLAFVILLITLL